MTNMQIIETECVLRGITENVNTYQGWARNGQQVKKGEKALFQTLIWKPRKNVKVEATEEMTEEEMKSKFIMVKAYFFGMSQTEAR